MSVHMIDDAHLAKLYRLRLEVDRQIKELEATLKNARKPKVQVAECGTDGGYYRHRRTLGEPACAACKRAHRDYERMRAMRAKGAA